MGKKKISGGESWIQPISSVEKMVEKLQPAPIPQMQSMQIPTGGNIDMLSGIIHSLNTNPYLIGMLMLLLNLGGRFLSFELTKKQEAFLQQAWLRPFIFFTVIFIATRNLAVAFWVTLFFFFVIWIIANENSPFCLIPGWKSKQDENQTENPEQVYTTNIQKMQHDAHAQIPHGPDHSTESQETQESVDSVGTLGAPNDSNTT
jgi:hypothetical protein